MIITAAGTLRLVTSNGRQEKTVEAHAGAVLCVRWSPDGKKTGETVGLLLFTGSQSACATLLQVVYANSSTAQLEAGAACIVLVTTPVVCATATGMLKCVWLPVLQVVPLPLLVRTVKSRSGQGQACCAPASQLQMSLCTA